jgi:hypothetical protein
MISLGRDFKTKNLSRKVLLSILFIQSGLAFAASDAPVIITDYKMATELSKSTYSPDGRYRYGEVKRLANGKIARSLDMVAKFKQAHPCPVTGKSEGPCFGWEIDHVIPLSCNGIDEVENMQWLPTIIKTSRGTIAKDRWERKVYCRESK